MLRERLIQCGWRDDLKEFCKDVIRRKGLEKVTIEELVEEITPKGRGEIDISRLCDAFSSRNMWFNDFFIISVCVTFLSSDDT